jgi:hypothetical protein
MARIRTVKPEMAQDEDLATVSIEAQLLAIRLLNHADDDGYFKANPALVKATCFPLIDSVNVPGMLRELSDIGYIQLAEGADGKHYGFVVTFSKHQRVSKPYPSKIKDIVSFTDHSATIPQPFPERSALEKEKERSKGKDICAPNGSRFDDWWNAYDKKVGRKKCLKVWKARKLDSMADELIADAKLRHETCPNWKGGFQHHPLTYLNGDLWDDEIQTNIPKSGTSVPKNDAAALAWGSERGIKPKVGESMWNYRARLEAA